MVGCQVLGGFYDFFNGKEARTKNQEARRYSINNEQLTMGLRRLTSRYNRSSLLFERSLEVTSLLGLTRRSQFECRPQGGISRTIDIGQ